MNLPKIKNLKDAPVCIDQWEDNIWRLKREYDEDIGDGLKKAILIEMLPGNLIEGVMVRLKKGDDFLATKDLILSYVETKVDFGEPVPVDCANLNFHYHEHQHEQDGSDEVHGLGKGEEGGGGFRGRCNACGEFGHKALDCIYRWNIGKGKGEYEGDHKGGKVGGKGACWVCGELGHRAAQCPKGWGKKGFGKKGAFPNSYYVNPIKDNNTNYYIQSWIGKGASWKGKGKGPKGAWDLGR